LSGHVDQSAGGNLAYGDADGVTVKVFDANGAKLLAQGSTDSAGDLAAVSVPSGSIVVRLSKEGYVDQAVPLTLNDHDGNFFATLLPVAFSQSFDAHAGGVFTGPDGAAVTVKGDSFVTASDNQPVSGTIEVRITPYNAAANPDGFPGSPMQSDGIMVSLGMADFSFFQNGQKLQLASGKSATITVPLYSALNPETGAVLKVGDGVPAWSMNDATGQWGQELTGTVVNADASYSGLAMKVEVPHFTWWNCDYLRGTRMMTLKIYVDVESFTCGPTGPTETPTNPEGQGLCVGYPAVPYTGPASLSAIFSTPTLTGNGLAVDIGGLGYGYSVGGNTPIYVVDGYASVLVPADAVKGEFAVSVKDYPLPEGGSPIGGPSTPPPSTIDLFGYLTVDRDAWLSTETTDTIFLRPHPWIRISSGIDSIYFNNDQEVAAGNRTVQYSVRRRFLNHPIVWKVNGIPGGNDEIGTIEGGLYRTPSGDKLNALLSGSNWLTISAESGTGGDLDYVYDTQYLLVARTPLAIYGQAYGSGKSNVGGYAEMDYSNNIEILSYAIHNMSTDKFAAYRGNAGHPLTDVQWSLGCSMFSSISMYGVGSQGECLAAPNPDPDPASPQAVIPPPVVAPVTIADDGTLSVGDVKPQKSDGMFLGDSIPQPYGMPSIWLTGTSGEWSGVLRLVVSPVEDPIGDKVNIVIPQVVAEDTGASTVTDGQVKVQRTAPAAAVVSPITWGIVCIGDCPAGGPTISTNGMLSGTDSLGSGNPDSYYVTADWTTNGQPNHLVSYSGGGLQPLMPAR